MDSKLYSKLEKILYTIEKPARYCPVELNSYKKKNSKFRMAISYPDLYEVAMSNNGIRILYNQVNKIEDLACDRVFSVTPEFFIKLKENNIPLYTLETLTPVGELDLIGFNVSHQLLYTNILQILDLGNIPLLVRDRKEKDPIIIAGGESVSNPAPVVDFIDAFFVGDGEEGVVNIAEALKEAKELSKTRAEKLKILSEIDGVFVPTLYEKFEQNEYTCYKGKTVKKVFCQKDKLDDPENPIVSTMRISQERAAVTITRGCYNLCKFCHAGYYNLPYRSIEVDSVETKIEKIIKNSGYNELSLSSLSVSDYRNLVKLLNKILPTMIEKGVSISLPSMKVDVGTLPIIEAVSDIRKSSLTFAVETASNEIRKIIHKRLSIDDLLSIVKEVFNKGWKTIKLYFMLGLPGYQEYDEAETIIELLKKINYIGNKRKNINVTISPFVPKPHTPFQWNEMASREYFDDIVLRIKKNVPRNISIKNHDIDTSILEGVFSRADEKLGKVILQAYNNGCVLDSWNEFFKPATWYQALNENLPGWEKYLKGREEDSTYPWSVIKTRYDNLITKKKNEVLSDNDLEKLRCNFIDEIDKNAIEQAKEKFKEKYNVEERLRLIFTKKDRAKFISHLDLIEVLTKALRIVDVPMSFSQGFHKREKISAGFPLPLGIESNAEIIDVDCYKQIDENYIYENIQKGLPEGINIVSVKKLEKKESIMGSVSLVKFETTVLDEELLEKIICNLDKNISIEKKSKRGQITVYFNDAVKEYKITDNKLMFLLSIGSSSSVRIDKLLLNLAESNLEDMHNFKIIKIAQYIEKDNQVIEL